MKALLLCLLLFTGQLNRTASVVRPPSGATVIPNNSGGKLVELLNAPANVDLPLAPTSTGTAWSVEIKNLGPHAVTIRASHHLAVSLLPNESATFAWRGSSTYVRTR
jgi:hypothetical protein